MPVGVQCPISSSLGEFPAIGIGSGVLGFRPYWCPSPFAFHTWYFPFAVICHWISLVFLLYSQCIATHSVDPFSAFHKLMQIIGEQTINKNIIQFNSYQHNCVYGSRSIPEWLEKDAYQQESISSRSLFLCDNA